MIIWKFLIYADLIIMSLNISINKQSDNGDHSNLRPLLSFNGLKPHRDRRLSFPSKFLLYPSLMLSSSLFLMVISSALIWDVALRLIATMSCGLLCITERSRPKSSNKGFYKHAFIHLENLHYNLIKAT